MLFIFQEAISSTSYFSDFFDTVKHQDEKPITNIPLCVTGPKVNHCYTLVYSPKGVPEVDSIIRYIQDNNEPKIPDDSVIGFATPDEIDSFLFYNLNTTQGSLLFDINEANATLNETMRTIKYTIQVNTTDNFAHGIAVDHRKYVMIPLTYQVEKAILAVVGNIRSWNVNLIEFPHEQLESIDIIGNNGPIFIFAALIVNFVIALGQIVTEKELKLRANLKIMGLYDSAYWTSWFLTLSFFNTCSVFLLIISGCIFQFNSFLNNAFGLYFFLLELFALSLVSLTFLLSTIVKKSDSATTLGFAMFFIGYFLQVGSNVVFASKADVNIRNILSLLSPTLLQVGLANLGAATVKPTSPGLGWDAVNKPELTSISIISFAEIYGWLILDFFLYLILALYLDNVLSNEYGVSRPWYYFVTYSYWTGKVKVTDKRTDKKLTTDEEYQKFDEDVKEEEKTIFEGPLPEQASVVLRNVGKVYKRSNGACKRKEHFNAVKDLSFYIEENTLFCLLGPNGAGKSTTISMLVGFHDVTYGDATIFGYSIRDQMDQIQSLMGLCQQHDVLWGELTAREHLQLFAGLKNIPVDKIDEETDRLLKEVGLMEDSNLRTASYSAGQRRCLSISIALIGNPKIIILDEPTTGMDPVNRREVWNVIEKAKKNRIILLTTHAMEEADVLSDKIGIVAKGRLQCIGSSLHLKQKYGSGYNLTVGVAESHLNAVQDFVLKFIPNATIKSTTTTYITFGIDRDSQSELTQLFKGLDENTKDLCITDYQLAITTLENVFLTVAENSDPNLAAEFNVENDDIQVEDITSLESGTTTTTAPVFDEFSMKSQFNALMKKTAVLQWRDTKTNICQLLTPFVFVSILLGFQVLIDSIIDSYTIPEMQSPPTIPGFHLLSLASLEQEDLQNSNNIIFEHLNQQNGVKLYYTMTNDVSNSVIGNYQNTSGILGQIEPSYNTPYPVRFDNFGNRISQQLFSFKSYSYPYSFESFPSKDDLENKLFSLHNALPSVTAGYYFKNLNFIENEFSWGLFYNHSLTRGEDVPILMNRMTNAITKSLNNPFRVVLAGVKPMPTFETDGVQVDIISEGGTLAFTLILHQLLPVFMTSIVTEKESKIRELMKMTGLKLSLYWIVHYLFDYFIYLIVSSMLVISGHIYSVRFFTLNDFGTYYLLFLLWGHVLIAMSFLFSVFFNSKKSSTVVGYVLIIAIGIFSYVIMDNLLGDFDKVPNDVRLGVTVIPSLALYRGLMYLTAEVRNEGPGYRFADVGNEAVNLSSVYIGLFIEWLVIMLIWLYLEQVIPTSYGIPKHPLFFLGFKTKENFTETKGNGNETTPSDVTDEKHKVNVDVKGEEYSVRVLDAYKRYPSVDGNPPKMAVKGVTFGIEPNSAVVILGHNGAGKTTTLNLMIGLLELTAGSIEVLGYSIHDNLPKIHTFAGVCTQYELLWENMTAHEHLVFYGTLRKLKGKQLKQQMKSVLKKLNLYESRHVVAGKYSGGMKRRLSVAIALLGFPKYILLDEPSTGLDPKSRNRMWSLINEAKKYSTLLLTSHSMEEADALADRIIIMEDGTLKCIGGPSDLKARYGATFKLSVQVAKGRDPTALDQYIKSLVPSAVLMNSLAGTSNYQIPKESISIGEVFEKMEEKKSEFGITDYAITHTTLEEVFLKISEEGHTPKESTSTDIEVSENAFQMKTFTNKTKEVD